MEENEKYVPPYNLTSKMLELIAEIMEKVGQISKFVNFKSQVKLLRTKLTQFTHRLPLKTTSFQFHRWKMF